MKIREVAGKEGKESPRPRLGPGVVSGAGARCLCLFL